MCKKYESHLLILCRQLFMQLEKKGVIFCLRTTSAYDHSIPNLIFNYSPLHFGFHDKVLIFFLFFTIAHTLISWKIFFILFDSTKVAISSLKILLMTGLSSISDPGNMQQILSLACVLEASTVKYEGEVFSFLLFGDSTFCQFSVHFGC